MKKKINRFIRNVLILMWAFAFAQGPEFINQYENHLQGHVQELIHQRTLMQQLTGVELPDYIEKIKSSDETDLEIQVTFLERLEARFHKMQNSLQELTHSPPWLIPLAFGRSLDTSIVQETLNTFNMGVPVTWLSGIYALVGGILGYMIYLLIATIFRRIGSLFSRDDKRQGD